MASRSAVAHSFQTGGPPTVSTMGVEVFPNQGTFIRWPVDLYGDPADPRLPWDLDRCDFSNQLTVLR